VIANMAWRSCRCTPCGLELARQLVVLDIAGLPIVRRCTSSTCAQAMSPAAEALRDFVLEQGEP